MVRHRQGDRPRLIRWPSKVCGSQPRTTSRMAWVLPSPSQKPTPAWQRHVFTVDRFIATLLSWIRRTGGLSLFPAILSRCNCLPFLKHWLAWSLRSTRICNEGVCQYTVRQSPPAKAWPVTRLPRHQQAGDSIHSGRICALSFWKRITWHITYQHQ